MGDCIVVLHLCGRSQLLQQPALAPEGWQKGCEVNLRRDSLLTDNGHHRSTEPQCVRPRRSSAATVLQGISSFLLLPKELCGSAGLG